MNYPSNSFISVIITTKNEEKNIENCLKSILQQTYSCDKVEIIVVDNSSTDRTKDIIESFKVKNCEERYKVYFITMDWNDQRREILALLNQEENIFYIWMRI